MRLGLRLVFAITLFVVMAIVNVASAAPPQAPSAAATVEADGLFAQGRDLLEKGRFAEACEKLQRSEELSPAIGTLLNLGYCREQLGKLRSAMDAYSEADILATAANETKRSQFAKERFTAVEARVLKVVIRVVAPIAPNLEVVRNGTKLLQTDWGQAIPVDPGDFVIEAHAPGRLPWRTVVAARGEASVVTVYVPPLESQARDTNDGPVLDAKRVSAIAIGLVGAVALGAGIAVESTDDRGTAGVLLLAGGAVSLGVGGTLWFLGGKGTTVGFAGRFP